MKFSTIIIISSVFLLLFAGISNYEVHGVPARFLQTEDISTNLAVPEGLIFSPDGTKMYVTDDTGDLIEEYALSNPWNISTATHSGSNLAIADAQTNQPEDFAFNADGTKMFLVDRTGDLILEYNLSTAYDVSTAVYQSGQNGDVGSKTENPEDIAFNADGTKMYILDNHGADEVLEYALGAAYDVSDETYTDKFTITIDGNAVDAFEFSSDGNKMFLADASGITQYNLSTAWDISSSVYRGILDTTSVMGNPKGLAFSSNGLNLYITGTSDAVHQYTLERAWDLFLVDNESNTYSPHIHDEVIVSINSNEIFVLDINDTDVTTISSNIGDTINITISVGDDGNIEQITPIKLVTNFAKKPGDMNNYFATNILNGQTGLSVYELNQNTVDQNYSYGEVLTWNDSTTMKRDRVLTNHDDVGHVLLNEQELVIKYSMIANNVAKQTPVMVKITDNEYMQTVVVLPLTLEILPNLTENSTEEVVPEIESPVNDKSEFFIKSDKSAYVHGNKVVITGQIPIQDFDPKQAQNIIFSIISPENQSIVTGEFAPKLDGSFTYDTFAMDTIWKTDGDYIFNFNFKSITFDLIISYDNTKFQNLNLQINAGEKVVEPVVTPPVVTPPVVTPPVVTPPVVTPPVVTPPVVTPPVVTPPVVTPPVVEQKIVERIMPTCGTGTEDVNGICQVVQTPTNEKSKGGGCLIATATYGSEMATEVQQLRELRDNTLLNTASGTAFMSTFNDIYYSFSPIIADYERENPLFKEAVKIAITPMISSLSLMDNANSESKVLGLGLSVIMLNIGMYLGVPSVVIIVIKKKF